MPRPSKPINPGRLDGDVTSARPHTWTKHSSEPGSSEVRGAPSSIEVTVDEITIVEEATSEPEDAATDASKYQSRGTAAHIVYSDAAPQPPTMRFEEQWSTDRSIEGRTYRRIDTMTRVAVPI